MSEQPMVILLAHGSSDPKWCETFEKLAAPTIAAVPGSVVAYMELAEPSMESIVTNAVEQGCHNFTIMPLFLAVGRHLRKDVPEMISVMEKTHKVKISLAPPIGENPQLGLAIREVVEQTLNSSRP
ncbi:MAG: CbiX/SirB N-terminal domain-containing protein [Marinobacter sp.]|uniref:sirohydrochlorin chelatase n=1 Tax=Marinobacter sp. TaxID=50741 RepID=UPI00349FF95C